MPMPWKMKKKVGEGNASVEIDSTEKVQRRQSKRDFFRRILKRSSITSQTRKQNRQSAQTLQPIQPTRPIQPMSPSIPTSPMDKPLPPPPPGMEEAEQTPTNTKLLKLNRIIQPISLPELHSIFSGAPQFFARSEGHFTGAPHPSVAFPWDVEIKFRNLSDHLHIQDAAWACVTAWPHITYKVRKNPQAMKEHQERQRAHFVPRCRERPNMLSMQGKERGTTGYQAALEMGVADALEVPTESANGGVKSILQHRNRVLNSKDGVRPITDTTLIERLQEVSDAYHSEESENSKPTFQLYTQLFTQILYPPARVTDSEDPYSLKVQIEALVSVLSAPQVWYNFTLIEWRIRLGQLLWGPSSEVDQNEPTANNQTAMESADNKFWLLLQILLSCELLVRLDAITKDDGKGLTAAEIERFEKDATTSVKWSLILARSWLENIQVSLANKETIEEKKHVGWLATLTGTTNVQDTPPTIEGIERLRFRGRHQPRQLDGLLHFAEKMSWPDMKGLAARISANEITVSDTVARGTPSGTPLSLSTQSSSSYFSKRRPQLPRGLSSYKNVSAVLNPDGWLSNSYLSGLILPGEGLSHFLMSTLLENDPEAVGKLGDQANLYGGFIYAGRSFWSTSCVVGRILAAGKGASECMGWVSSEVVPRGAKGWVDLDVEYPILENKETKSGKPRLWHKTTIEHDGNVVGGADMLTVLPGDFVLPSDEPSQPPFQVDFESLDLFSADDDSHDAIMDEDNATIETERAETTDMPSIQTYSAMMRFSVQLDTEEKREMDVAITHDVQFVTAHPCIPPPPSEILRSPTTPTFQSSKSPTLSLEPSSKGHPLHKAFTFTTIPLSTLVSSPSSTPLSSFLSPPVSPPKTADTTTSSTHTTNSTIPRILLIDCTTTTITDISQLSVDTIKPVVAENPLERAKGKEKDNGKKRRYGSDLEMFVRALCAERGWNVLVARRGRCCISCVIREAGALGWRVVIRLA